MKRHWIEFGEQWVPGPLSYWVHVETDGRHWYEAEHFDPPKPKPVPGRGYAQYRVEYDGVLFYFASVDEMRACVATLSTKLLPTTLAETRRRGAGRIGPNQHWLSRLPAKVRPWRFRENAVAYLRKALAQFEREAAAVAPKTGSSSRISDG